MASAPFQRKKLECGLTLVILGVQVSLAEAGFRLLPAKAKVQKCMAAIRGALETGVLKPGCAEKLAGRLSWAVQVMFYRIGRAMIRPVFDQKRVGNGVLSSLRFVCSACECMVRKSQRIVEDCAELVALHSVAQFVRIASLGAAQDPGCEAICGCERKS